MRRASTFWLEFIASAVAVATAYGVFALGFVTAGRRAAVLTLIVAVPFGVLVGSLMSRLLPVMKRLLLESDEEEPR